MKNKKIILAILILLIANLPYVLHIEQDLFDNLIPYQIVNHNEASYGMNAKDIILFGWHSLAHDRLYIVWALSVLIVLISFSIFGISLAALRLPYIGLNIIANIIFFDLVRRCSNRKIAAVVTLFFALYPSRLLIGKSAMVEAMVLPLIVGISWLLMFTHKKPRVYFLLGVLSGLVGIAKVDNLIVFVILLLFASIEDVKELRLKEEKYFPRTLKLLLGGLSIFFVWGIFGFVVGFGRFLYYYRYELSATISGYWSEYIRNGQIGSLGLIKENLIRFWDTDPLLILSLWVLAILTIRRIFKKSDISGDYFLKIILLFLGIFLFKIIFSRALSMWHLAPTYPLYFLLLGYLFIFLGKLNLGKIISKFTLLRCAVLCLTCALVLFFTLPLIKKVIQRTQRIIFSPTYKILSTVESLKRTLNPSYRLIFAEGHFAYSALLLPFKCYDIEPNIETRDFFALESDPRKIWSTIERDKDIAYIMFRKENRLVSDFVKSIPGAQLIITDLFSFEPGYVYQIRWPQQKGKTSSNLRGKWE